MGNDTTTKVLHMETRTTAFLIMHAIIALISYHSYHRWYPQFGLCLECELGAHARASCRLESWNLLYTSHM